MERAQARRLRTVTTPPAGRHGLRPPGQGKRRPGATRRPASTCCGPTSKATKRRPSASSALERAQAARRVDLAHAIAEGHASSEAREDAYTRVAELRATSPPSAPNCWRRRSRQDAEGLSGEELEKRLKALRKVSCEQTVTATAARPPDRLLNVPTKLRTIYVPTRPAPATPTMSTSWRSERTGV